MKTVLLVEDDQAVREALQLTVELYGFSVICAQNGQEALVWLHSGAPLPGLVLLDLMMPVMDGYEFIEQRNRDPKLAAIPIVVMSARSHFKEGLEGVVADCLSKPIDLDTLIATVRKFCL